MKTHGQTSLTWWSQKFQSSLTMNLRETYLKVLRERDRSQRNQTGKKIEEIQKEGQAELFQGQEVQGIAKLSKKARSTARSNSRRTNKNPSSLSGREILRKEVKYQAKDQILLLRKALLSESRNCLCMRRN